MNNTRLKVNFLLCFSLWVCCAVLPALPAAPDTVAGNEAAETAAVKAEPARVKTQTPGLGLVNIRLLVPQKKAAVDNFIIYPYPVRPPSNDKQLTPLPKTMKALRTALFDSGYGNRSTSNRAYLANGWRWRYIFQTAVDKSHLSLPTTVVGAYVWVDNMVPYALPELKKINAAERIRVKRYERMKEFWDLNGVDLENKATLSGRRPYEVTFNNLWTAHARLPEGNWWVVGTHRITGLVFYWQEPIKVTAGNTSYLNLDEWNALVVQGNW